jgi:hypothetical protein
MRISNPQALVNEEVRVQNEVAAMWLTRQALSGYELRLVPEAYGWCPSSDDRGWILEEYKEGVNSTKPLVC